MMLIPKLSFYKQLQINFTQNKYELVVIGSSHWRITLSYQGALYHLSWSASKTTGFQYKELLLSTPTEKTFL